MSSDEKSRPEGLRYFSYGSNMTSAIFRERRGMNPLASQAAVLEDYRLCFSLPIGPGERGVANIEPTAGARIWGVLYLLTEEDFDRLDRTEGVHVGVYRRLEVEALLEGGDRIAASTYQSTWKSEGRKPSARYLRLLIEGAGEHGLPAEYVRFLESFELAVDEREARRTADDAGERHLPGDHLVRRR